MLSVEDHVLVNLVGDRDQIVAAAEVGDRFQLGSGEHPAGGVVRRVDDDRPGRLVDRCLEI